MAVCYQVLCREHQEDMEIHERRLDKDEDLIIEVGPCAGCIEDAKQDGAADAPSQEEVDSLKQQVEALEQSYSDLETKLATTQERLHHFLTGGDG